MSRDDQLREAFVAWFLSNPGGPKMNADGFLDTMSGQFWWEWEIFTAGANAAMDMQFEPGAVRFGAPIIVGPATPEDIVTPDFGNPPTFMGKPVVFVDEDFGPKDIIFGPPPDFGGES